MDAYCGKCNNPYFQCECYIEDFEILHKFNEIVEEGDLYYSLAIIDKDRICQECSNITRVIWLFDWENNYLITCPTCMIKHKTL